MTHINKTNQHIVPRGNNRAVIGAGNKRATRIVPTQTEAIAVARPIAQNSRSELFIHRPNGQIRDRESYGKDPFPPKG